MVRGKFTVMQHVITKWNAEHPGQTQVVLQPQYDSSIEEDRRYAKATPAGKIEMTVDNPAALEQLALGKAFYVDFTEVPEHRVLPKV
jgi:hypothetical protein